MLTGSITGALMRRDKTCQNAGEAFSSSASLIGEKCMKKVRWGENKKKEAERASRLCPNLAIDEAAERCG